MDYGFQPLAKVESTVRFDPPYDKVIPATEVLYVCWSRPDGLKLDIHPDGKWSFLVVFANASAFTISARPGPGSDLPNRTGFVSSGSFEEDIVLAERLIDEATKSGKRPLLVVDRETLQLQHDVWESYLAFDPAGMFGGETREMLTSVESNPWPSRVGMVALLIFAGAIAVYVQSWLLFGVSLLVIASAKLLLDLTVRRWRQRIMESIDLDHPPQLSP